MNEVALSADFSPRASPVLWVALGISLLGHGVLLLYLNARPVEVEAQKKPVELVMVDVLPPPKPPEPVKEMTPPREPPPIKVAAAPKPPPPSKEVAPPPPNETPPPAPTQPVPLVVGISMSSTTAAGGFAAPVGNTLDGKTADKAASPQDVKRYSAPRYTPIYQVDSEPQVSSEVKVPYPEEARKAGIEGTVTLSITIDIEGTVVSAKILGGPGYGLNEAARDAIRKFKFKPAIKGGEAVSTEMKYAYTFLLD